MWGEYMAGCAAGLGWQGQGWRLSGMEQLGWLEWNCRSKLSNGVWLTLLYAKPMRRDICCDGEMKLGRVVECSE
ncbi:MAG: hypothetical protein AB7S48_17140 [Bacteroidales bacterium]